MKFDAIVTEQGSARPTIPWSKLLLAAPAFVFALYLLGDQPDAQQQQASPPASNDVALIKPQNDSQRSRSLLDELNPIAKAEASVRPPRQAAANTVDYSELDAAPATLTTTSTSSNSATDNTLPAADQLATNDPQLTRLQDKVIEVQPGDSLSVLFARHDLNKADWMALAKLNGEGRRLRKLLPGDKLKLGLDADGRLAALDMRLNDLSSLKVRRNEAGKFVQTVNQDKVETRQKRVFGHIENSLFVSAKAAGLSDKLTMELTEIFAWDIDFALDIRSDDRFEVLFEEIYKDGKKIKDGRILAASFTNRGKETQAVYYADGEAGGTYYSPNGKPMKKAFLRSPVDFTRISSRFSAARKHPVLNRVRAHKGVDYAAPSGTPIRAASAGKVVFAGNKGGYGRVVILQHAGKYKTLYAHMKGFRSGIKPGKSVAQGETIGYVGSSGLATGPHLHYELQVGGRHVDPLSVKLPNAPTIAGAKLADFKASTQPLLASLKTAQNSELALAQP